MSEAIQATSAAAAARQALRDLRANGSASRAAGASAYFKSYEKVRFFGVDSPTIRRMAADIARRNRGAWQLADAIAFTDILIARPELEAKAVGLCVLGRFRSEFTAALLPVARRWLERHCGDWASTDTLCAEVLGPLLLARPNLVSRLRSWRTSRALYVRRASCVALVSLARRGVALDDAYDAALILGAEEHHLLQKSAGWLLREAGKTDMPRLERFLLRHGRKLGRTTISYAIERFPPATRRRLLVSTRC